MRHTRVAMRKILSILLIFVLVASLSACGSAPTPKDTAEKFLTAVKAKDAEGIRKVYDGSYSEDELIGTVKSLLGDSKEGNYMMMRQNSSKRNCLILTTRLEKSG